MDSTGKSLILVCVGFGLIVGVEITRFIYDGYIIPNKLKELKEELSK